MPPLVLSTEINLPGGTGAKLTGSQPKAPTQPRAIETGNVKAGKDARLMDETEGGIKTGDIDAGQDAVVMAKPRPPTEDPKEGPPT